MPNNPGERFPKPKTAVAARAIRSTFPVLAGLCAFAATALAIAGLPLLAVPVAFIGGYLGGR